MTTIFTQNTISDLLSKKKLNSNLYCFQVPSLQFPIFSGMFSFFAVPILLGDITIDFMKMVDVMVDVMVMVTGTGTGSGNGNNNNNNNNNNGGEGGGEGEGGGNNNNNNNNNRRRRSNTGSSMAKC